MFILIISRQPKTEGVHPGSFINTVGLILKEKYQNLKKYLSWGLFSVAQVYLGVFTVTVFMCFCSNYRNALKIIQVCANAWYKLSHIPGTKLSDLAVLQQCLQNHSSSHTKMSQRGNFRSPQLQLCLKNEKKNNLEYSYQALFYIFYKLVAKTLLTDRIWKGSLPWV